MSLLSPACGRQRSPGVPALARPAESINFEITAACDARCIHCPAAGHGPADEGHADGSVPPDGREASELGVSRCARTGTAKICTIPMRLLEPYFQLHLVQAWPFKVDRHQHQRLSHEHGARRTCSSAHAVHLINVTIDGATAARRPSPHGLKFDDIEANIKNLLARRTRRERRTRRSAWVWWRMPQTLPEAMHFWIDGRASPTSSASAAFPRGSPALIRPPPNW